MAMHFVLYMVASTLVKKMVFQYCYHNITGSHDSVTILFSFL
jgi:hypothetical protein